MAVKFCYIFVIFAIFQARLVQANESCDKRAETAANVNKCCTYPMMAKAETIKSIVDIVVKTVDPSSTKFQCIFASKLFEELKLKDFDKAVYKTYMLTLSQDTEWLAVLENSTNFCIDNLPKYEKFYGKLFNVSKEDCDVRYIAFLDCVTGKSFKACPAKSFSDSTECKETKSFFTECFDEDKAMDVYVRKQLQMT